MSSRGYGIDRPRPLGIDKFEEAARRGAQRAKTDGAPLVSSTTEVVDLTPDSVAKDIQRTAAETPMVTIDDLGNAKVPEPTDDIDPASV